MFSVMGARQPGCLHRKIQITPMRTPVHGPARISNSYRRPKLTRRKKMSAK